MHWRSAAGMKSRWPVFRAGTGSIGTDPRTARFTPTRFDGEGFWSMRGVVGTCQQEVHTAIRGRVSIPARQQDDLRKIRRPNLSRTFQSRATTGAGRYRKK
jgi:hypothetical protein